MRRNILSGLAVFVITVALVFVASGCFSSASTGEDETPAKTATPFRPSPKVEKVVESTSGTEGAYYAILDIEVKNEEPKVLSVNSRITQNGKPLRMKCDLPQTGEDSRIEMTFPLVGG
jgi:hypothetical protein